MRQFSYDGLSRLLSATNPESGTVNYSYDANSNFSTKQDARSISTTFTYDAINRVTLKDYSDTTPDVSYSYDSATKGVGRLVSTTIYSSYDALGRLLTYNQQTQTNTYARSSTYSKAGLMTDKGYPSGKTVHTDYDGTGRVSTVIGQRANVSEGLRLFFLSWLFA